jgi:hypothetical protein
VASGANARHSVPIVTSSNLGRLFFLKFGEKKEFFLKVHAQYELELRI